jgi:hypothetical protein
MTSELGVRLAPSSGVKDRRATGARLALVRRIMDEVFTHPWFTVNASDCRRIFGISPEICARILAELERAGVIRQTRRGTWMRKVVF